MDLWAPGIAPGAGGGEARCFCWEQWDALPDVCRGLEGGMWLPSFCAYS